MELINKIQKVLVEDAIAEGREVSDDRFYTVDSQLIQVSDRLWAISIEFPEEISSCSNDSPSLMWNEVAFNVDDDGYSLSGTIHGRDLKFKGMKDHPYLRVIFMVRIDNGL